jgi:hypothetical protein
MRKTEMDDWMMVAATVRRSITLSASALWMEPTADPSPNI